MNLRFTSSARSSSDKQTGGVGMLMGATHQPRQRRPRIALLPNIRLITWLFSLATRVVLLIILLGVLGYLILFAYFLAGRTWSMPVVLSAGQERVVRAQHDWVDVNLKLADVEGRLQGLRRQIVEVENSLEIARISAAAEINTVRTELRQNDFERDNLAKALANTISAHTDAANLLLRITKLPDPEENFDGGLINRARFLTDMLARTELGIKIAALSANIEEIATRRAALEARRVSLRTAEAIMQGKPGEALSARELDYVRVWSQSAISLRMGEEEKQHLQQELKNLVVVHTEIQDSLRVLAASPTLRAARSPGATVFVTYSNAITYKPGQPIYRCRLWLMFCSPVGIIGQQVDGETTSVHPFFHSVSRGSFYTVDLAGNTQAAEDSLLFSAPPFLF